MLFLDRLALWIGRFASVGFLVIAGMMVWEVGMRYGFNQPTYWAHEIAGVLAAIAFIFGGAYCMAEQSHMTITLLLDRMPPPFRRAVQILSLIAGSIYLAGMSWAMWLIFHKNVYRFASDGSWMPERSGTSWNTPTPAFIKLALLLGSILFLAIILRQLLSRSRLDTER